MLPFTETMTSRLYKIFLITLLSAALLTVFGFSMAALNIPEEIVDLYQQLALEGRKQSEFDIRNIDDSTFEVIRKIPRNIRVKDLEIKGIIQRDEIMVMQLIPKADFFDGRENVRMPKILFDQLDLLKEKKILKSGFIKGDYPIFFVDLIHTVRHRQESALYCIRVQDGSLIEVVYSNSRVRLPRYHRPVSLIPEY